MAQEELTDHLQGMLESLLQVSIGARPRPGISAETVGVARLLMRELIEGVRCRAPIVDLRYRGSISAPELQTREAAINEIRMAILLVTGHGIRVRHDFDRRFKRLVRRNELAAELFILRQRLAAEAEQSISAMEQFEVASTDRSQVVAKLRACQLLGTVIAGLQEGVRVIDIRRRPESAPRDWNADPVTPRVAHEAALVMIAGALNQISDSGITVVHESLEKDLISRSATTLCLDSAPAACVSA